MPDKPGRDGLQLAAEDLVREGFSALWGGISMLDAGFVIAREGLRLTKKTPGNTGYGHAQPLRLGLPLNEAWQVNDPDGIGMAYLAVAARASSRFWRSVAFFRTCL